VGKHPKAGTLRTWPQTRTLSSCGYPTNPDGEILPCLACITLRGHTGLLIPHCRRQPCCRNPTSPCVNFTIPGCGGLDIASVVLAVISLPTWQFKDSALCPILPRYLIRHPLGGRLLCLVAFSGLTAIHGPNPGPCPLFSSSQRPRLAPATAFLRATAFFPNPPAQMPTVKAYLRAS
jgi:hypothetical protein